MGSNHVTVVYKWTAKPGKLDELASIYKSVTHAMEQNEPGAEGVQLYVSEGENALIVREEFADAAAVGFHLSTTAAQHFPNLLAIAVPGPFLFLGDVPDEIKQATQRMQLGASFAEHVAGFDRESGR